MDTGEGRFEIIDERRKGLLLGHMVNTSASLKKSGVFEIGEEVEIKGSRFKISNIMTHSLSLKLLPSNSREQLIKEFKQEYTKGKNNEERKTGS